MDALLFKPGQQEISQLEKLLAEFQLSTRFKPSLVSQRSSSEVQAKAAERYETPPGRQAQVDWGRVTVETITIQLAWIQPLRRRRQYRRQFRYGAR